MNNMTAMLPDLKLRFRIEHPSFEECYAFGFDCAQAEISESENPYHLGSKESEQWLEGWWAGFYGEPSLYEVEYETSHPEKTNQVDAANDHVFYEGLGNFIVKVMEISGMLAVSAAVGYQVLDLVA